MATSSSFLSLHPHCSLSLNLASTKVKGLSEVEKKAKDE